MITLQQILNITDYNNISIDSHCFNCFGDNTALLSSSTDEYAVNAIFNKQTNRVFLLEAHDYTGSSYRWIDPRYAVFYVAECVVYDIDYIMAYDDVEFTDLQTISDILEKATKIANCDDYSPDVDMVIKLHQDQYNSIMREADALGISYQKYFTQTYLHGGNYIK